MSTYRLRRQNSRIHASNDSVKFRTDLQKQCLINCAEERKWTLTDSEDEWNIYWANVGKIRKIFNLESGIRLRDDQIVNHFPNHCELTRKDLMVKNIKRYKKNLDKQQNKASQLLDFVPLSYNLPGDYPIFEEEFRKQVLERMDQIKREKKGRKYNPSDSNNTESTLNYNNFNTKQRGSKWILKPASRAQGSGIFIINRLSQLKKWTNSSKYNNNETYVISKYIEKPLLIGGRKFDLRLFALITSYRPLKIYFYSKGFARFSNVKYTTERDQMNNTEVHLTNVAIQKHSDDYNPNHGNKWSFDNVILYIQSNFGNEKADIMMRKIKEIIIYSSSAVKNVMINDKHCFECYGFDIIIDENLKPWLIEINASPSLSATTKADRIFKRKLIFDLFKIVIPDDFPSIKTTQGYTSWCNKKQIGDFYLLYSEEDCEDGDDNDKYHEYGRGDGYGNYDNSSSFQPLNNHSRYSANTSNRKPRSTWR